MNMLHKIRDVPFARGLLISLGIHGLVVAVLLLDFAWPEPLEEPQPEVVEVTLVPPPPEPEPMEQAPEGEVPEEEVPEEQPAEEEIAEPPAGEPQAPEPEQPEAAEPAPLPEPEPVEAEPEPVEPGPEEEQAPPAEPDPAESATGEAVPIPTLRPVFEFGEEDRGPDPTADGGRLASEAEPQADEPETGQPPETEPQTPPDGDAPVSEETAETTEAPAEAETEADTAGTPVEAEPLQDLQPGLNLPELALPENSLVPETGEADGDAVAGLPLAETAPSDDPLPETVEDTQPDAAEEPDPAPEPAAPGDPAASETSEPVDLAEADRLFSPDLTQNRAAMSAMGDLPRELRASQLCTTELREQLRYGAPAYRPEMLPAYRLDAGNVLTVPDAAFRAEGAWYDLSFRCTVDDGALRVIGFALTVGDPIPREDWAARGFPEF